MDNIVRISVRAMVEFVMRSGDIDNTFVSNARAIDGIRAHQKIQSSYGDNYYPEVVLRHNTTLGGIDFRVDGRCDGILLEDGEVTIEEIKSTTRDLLELNENSNPLHWAQGMCYAYFYGVEQRRSEVKVQLTYYNIETEEIRRFLKTVTIEELQIFYEGLLMRYLEFSKRLAAWRSERQRTSQELKFPFSEYRKGQREMAVAVYSAIEGKKNLFVDAPTGIGKTMSALFPAVKALGTEVIDKIFYLTPRTTTKQEAEKATFFLTDRGLKFKSCVVTAKDRICTNDEVSCNPKACPYAKGHFDRVNDAIIDLMDNEDLLNQQVIERYAVKHRVCPFEFQLDMTVYSDLVICDYNYAFDPQVYLRRFFEGTNERYVFLVDEAHNLVDRGRVMFSAEFHLSDFEEMLSVLPETDRPAVRLLERGIKTMINWHGETGKKEEYYTEEHQEIFAKIAKGLTSKLEPFLIKEKDHEDYDKVLNFYFLMNRYMRIDEYYGKGFVTILQKQEDGDLMVKIFCVDTSKLFKEILKRAASTVFFSATLTPMSYYQDVLGGGEEDLRLHLPSPFAREHMLLVSAVDVSTKYHDRERSIDPICHYIHTATQKKKGNYFVFFPSYRYLDQIVRRYEALYGSGNLVVQDASMTEGARREFIAAFQSDTELLGFVVLGGVFAEGIDLTGERLLGSIVISVGLPGLSLEINMIKAYFDGEKGSGFEYAYQFPGMNKVLQGAGRVIRTPTDKGVVLLIDDRFQTRRYRELYPKHWQHMDYVKSTIALEALLDGFWGTETKGACHEKTEGTENS